MTDKTIKELADDLGVSKDKIKYQVRKLPGNFTYKKGNVTYLKKIAIDRVSVALGLPDMGNKEEEIPINYLLEELNKKEEHIHTKDKQLAEKDNQIVTMQKLLDQQQQLTLQSNKRMEQLEIQLQLETKKSEEEFLSPETEDRSDQPPTPDKKWWHFLR